MQPNRDSIRECLNAIESGLKEEAGRQFDEADRELSAHGYAITAWRQEHPGEEVPEEMRTELVRLTSEYNTATNNFFPWISSWVDDEEEGRLNIPKCPKPWKGPGDSGGPGGGPGGSNNGGGSSTGGTGGASGSGTANFVSHHFEEFSIIIPFLLGFVSIIISINPEILMYFRLIITLIRHPAFKFIFILNI